MSTLDNEVNLIAVLIAQGDLSAKVFSAVPVDQFDQPLRSIAQVIQGLRADGHTVALDTVTEELRRRGHLGSVGGPSYVAWVAEHFVSADTLDYHLDAVAENRRQRRLWRVGQRLSSAVGGADSAAEIATAGIAEMQAVLDGATASGDVFIETLGDLLADETEATYDWVIPGLIERMDRMILTGIEGLGKSTLFRQFAVCIAAGIHPFTGGFIEPQRVLVLDVENSRIQSRRKLRPLALAALGQGRDPRDNMFAEFRPQGVDLLNPRDEAWFMSRVTAVQPSVIFTGSIYKLYEGDPNEERPARKVAAILDRARAATNAAIVLEAHTGHGTEAPGGPRRMRPYGASLWMRWPEFGYGIRHGEGHTAENRIVDFVKWRGDRDEREWPSRLRAGGTWPWQVASTFERPWTPTVHQGGEAGAG